MIFWLIFPIKIILFQYYFSQGIAKGGFEQNRIYSGWQTGDIEGNGIGQFPPCLFKYGAITFKLRLHLCEIICHFRMNMIFFCYKHSFIF